MRQIPFPETRSFLIVTAGVPEVRSPGEMDCPDKPGNDGSEEIAPQLASDF
jgi:hypothetical protein